MSLSTIADAVNASSAAGSTVGRCEGDDVPPGRAAGPDEAGAIGRRFVLGALLLAGGVFRVVCDLRMPFDSDEPQHLHVGWAWAHGLLPYRDVFDNHGPLANLLGAAVVAIAGERPDVVVLARLALLPIVAVVLWATVAIGNRLLGRGAGLWAATLLVVLPGQAHLFQYRPLSLWVALWLLAIVVLIGGRFSNKRAAIAGTLLGLALCVSLKTVLMLAALLAAALLLLQIPSARGPLRWRGDSRALLALLAGLVAPPLIAVAVFASQSALGPMRYCLIEHNVLPGVAAQVPLAKMLIAPLALVAMAFAGRRAARQGVALPHLFVGFVAGGYLALLSLWPTVPAQTLGPFWPLLVVLLVVALRPRLRSSTLWAASAVGLLASAAVLLRPWHDGTAQDEQRLAEVLRLTGPDDFVMDKKGELIFRRRAFFYVLEKLTTERFARGLIADTIADDCIARRTCVTVRNLRAFPRRSRAWLESHFVPLGALSVVGQRLGERRADAATTMAFDVAIPAGYAIVCDADCLAGTLDGQPWSGAGWLQPGPHRFVVAAGRGTVTLVWDRVVERGLTSLLGEP